MDWAEQNDLVAVRRCASRDQAEQYALVLTAMGLQSWIAPEGRMTALYVSHQDVARATEQLLAYDSENPRPATARAWRRPALPRVEVALAYWTVLLFFFAAARNQAFAFDWVGEGAVQSARMFSGEWWRAVTAGERAGRVWVPRAAGHEEGVASAVLPLVVGPHMAITANFPKLIFT